MPSTVIEYSSSVPASWCVASSRGRYFMSTIRREKKKAREENMKFRERVR
jgi:hypothetical protein